MANYLSFSTRNYYRSGGSLNLSGINVVKEDLMNHIFTPVRGSINDA
jgi:hypothetical protein